MRNLAVKAMEISAFVPDAPAVMPAIVDMLQSLLIFFV